MAQTPEDYITSIKKRLAYANPNLDLTSGNVATDLGVEAFAEELAALSTEEDRIRLLYLFEASAFTEDEADVLSNSFGIPRIQATKATGEVIFGATESPAEGSQYIIPVGTTVSTLGDSGSQITYTTITEGIIDANTPLNPSTNYYESIVQVEATVAGSSSNVGPGAINTIKSSVSGVSVVYNNDSIVNGTDKESKESLIARVKRNLVGYVYGTKPSLLNRVLSYGKVTDAFIVDPNNEFSVRGPGSIDIYILGAYPNSYTQMVTSKEQEVHLIKAPAIDNNSAVVTFNDGSTLNEGYGFNIIRDDTTIYSGSTKSKDKIVWTDVAYENYVLTHNYYTVTYTFNKLISDIQTEFDSDETHILTSDVLIRNTSELQARMDFDIVTLPGYDGNTVRSSVVYAIQTYVNNFKLNETLRQSDIIGIVEGVEGVDYVKLPMRAFCLVGEDKVEDIPSSPLEYIRITESNILIG